MRFCTLLVALLAAALGLAGLRLEQAGVLDFARLVLNQAYPSGEYPAHLRRGTGAFTRRTNFLPAEDLERWIATIHETGFLAAGYPRRPHASSFGEAFAATDGKCPFLYEIDETGKLCSLFNHIDLITYQIFVGGHLSLKFSVKALMAMITQYMIKLRTPMQEATRYNDTAIDMCGTQRLRKPRARPTCGSRRSRPLARARLKSARSRVAVPALPAAGSSR
jgi:hypothetical protein